MGRYQGLTTAFVDRLNAAIATLAGETYVYVPSPARAAPRAGRGVILEAFRDGRPFSSLPTGHAVDLLEPVPPATEPTDMSAPGAILLRQLESMRKAMASATDLPDLDALRAETVKAKMCTPMRQLVDDPAHWVSTRDHATRSWLRAFLHGGVKQTDRARLPFAQHVFEGVTGLADACIVHRAVAAYCLDKATCAAFAKRPRVLS